jgi:hypothetical protein
VKPSEANLEFDWAPPGPSLNDLSVPLAEQLIRFNEFSKATRQIETRATTFNGKALCVPTFVNEFWTAKQRAANKSLTGPVSSRNCRGSSSSG